MKKAKSRQAKGLPFYKLQGAGNDVIVFLREQLTKHGAAKVRFLRQMAHRQLGIGADQFVEVLAKRPLAIQIWNGDGTQAEMCANGTRSFLHLASRLGWIDASAKLVPIEVSGKKYSARRLQREAYELCLGTPVVGAPEMLTYGKWKIPFHAVSTGNPHAVVIHGRRAGEWQTPKDFSYLNFGPALEKHPRFPNRTNVEFVRGWKREAGHCRVSVEAWERGAGATLSCGSGAVAVAALLRRLGQGDRYVVKMTEFELRIRFEGEQAFLSGPCALVAEGRYFS